MKKLIVLGSIVCLSLDLSAQGTVNFGNNQASAVTNAVTGAKIPKGNTFTAQLWYAPDTGSSPSADDMQPLAGTTGIGPIAGLITGGTKVTPATTAPGGFAWFQIRIWETAYAATWEEAQTNVLNGRLAIAGTSNIIKVKTGDPNAVPPTTPGSLTGPAGLSFRCFGPPITCIPEPSVISVCLLGMAACFVLRRRGPNRKC